MDQNQIKRISRIKKIAKILDAQFQGPLNTKFGLDGLLGLIPGIGDLITSFFSGFILYESYKLGASPAVLFRMGLNILFENLVDTIPLLGNIFDFFWKANLKNVQLLEGHIDQPSTSDTQSKIVLISIFFFIFCLLILSLYTSYLIIKLLFEAFYLFAS